MNCYFGKQLAKANLNLASSLFSRARVSRVFVVAAVDVVVLISDIDS